MKSNFLISLTGILLVITLTSTSTVSGNNFDRRGKCSTSGLRCVNLISGITTDQKTGIFKLNAQHQSVMCDLREKRQATPDINKKNQIRQQMDAQIENHLKAVRSILSVDQQKQLDQGNVNKGDQPSLNNRCCKGYGFGRCQRHGFGWNKQA
jgi:hypothetical protein